MSELVHTEAATRATGTLGIVEDEIARTDLAIDEVMCGTARRSVELVRVAFARTGEDLHLYEAVADEQRRSDAGLNRFLVLPVDEEPIDYGVHVSHGRFVEFQLRGD